MINIIFWVAILSSTILEGLLKNIDDLQMHTEGSFQSPKINVWGISDKDLFLEANEVFRKKTNLFLPSSRHQIIIVRI